MMRFLGFLFLVSLAVGAWGFHKDWFSVQTSEQDGTWTITTEVHKHELGRDLDAYEQKLLDALDVLDRKIDDLRHRARSANAKSRPAIEQQLSEEERKKGEATELLRDLGTATPDELREKQLKLDAVLEGDESQPPQDGTPPEGPPPEGSPIVKPEDDGGH